MTTMATRKDAAARRVPLIDLTDPSGLFRSLLGEAWPGQPSWSAAERTVPGAAVEETDTEFTLEIEVPGVTKDDVSIDVTGRRVAVHGERVERQREGILRHTTRTTGRFDYEFTLPAAVEVGDATASLTDGVLTVRLPKSTAERPSHITIS